MSSFLSAVAEPNQERGFDQEAGIEHRVCRARSNRQKTLESGRIRPYVKKVWIRPGRQGCPNARVNAGAAFSMVADKSIEPPSKIAAAIAFVRLIQAVVRVISLAPHPVQRISYSYPQPQRFGLRLGNRSNQGLCILRPQP